MWMESGFGKWLCLVVIGTFFVLVALEGIAISAYWFANGSWWQGSLSLAIDVAWYYLLWKILVSPAEGSTVMYPTISDNPAIQEHYLRCREEGTSHALSEMFALSQPPMSNTDREFLEGRGGAFDQWSGNHAQGDWYKAQAEAAGVDVTGAVYMSGLASHPGDPEAWVRGRGDVQRIVEKRGWDSEGSVNVKAYRPQERPQIDVADDILEEEVQTIMEEHPEPQTVDRGELKDKVRQKRKPHWSK